MQGNSSTSTLENNIFGVLNLLIGLVWAAAGTFVACMIFAMSNHPSYAIPHLLLAAAAVPALISGIVLLPVSPIERPRPFAIVLLIIAVVMALVFWVALIAIEDHPWEMGMVPLVHFPACLAVIALVEVIYLSVRFRSRTVRAI
jgi:hypothetical protein